MTGLLGRSQDTRPPSSAFWRAFGVGAPNKCHRREHRSGAYSCTTPSRSGARQAERSENEAKTRNRRACLLLKIPVMDPGLDPERLAHYASGGSTMKALVLCGGRGTRLKPYTTVIPKPLMPIGDYPILEILLRQLQRAGVRESCSPSAIWASFSARSSRTGRAWA
jgi:nucleotidyltransferase-like protein